MTTEICIKAADLLTFLKEQKVKVHTAVSSGSWCGGQRQQCGDSGSGLR